MITFSTTSYLVSRILSTARGLTFVQDAYLELLTRRAYTVPRATCMKFLGEVIFNERLHMGMLRYNSRTTKVNKASKVTYLATIIKANKQSLIC
jgi:hypothetical protein